MAFPEKSSGREKKLPSETAKTPIFKGFERARSLP
jgi:hypothetical protein